MADQASFGRRGVKPVSRPPEPPRDSRPLPPPRDSRPQPRDFMPTPLDAETKAVWDARSAPRPLPVLTASIIGILALVYAGECRFNIGPIAGDSPGPNSLVALGAASRQLVFSDFEPWRLVTAVLLHANLAHIVGNGVVLLLVGMTMERLVGRAWFAALFVVCGLAGALASVLINPAAEPTVGASGAIIGLLGAALVCSFHPHAILQRRRNLFVVARLAVPALIPFSSVQGVNIDYNAHGGGFLAGLALGFIMLKVWPESRAHPGGERVATGIGLGGLLLAVLSFALVAARYPAYAAVGEPYATTLPKVTAETLRAPGFGDRAADLVRQFPRDPRTHFIRSLYFLSAQDMGDAEQEARAAINAYDASPHDLPALIVPELHLHLAGILLSEGRSEEAEAEIDPWCGVSFTQMRLEVVREKLIGGGLCRGWQAAGSSPSP
jgi:rhomboid protease GluP